MVFARDWLSSPLSVCSSPHLAKPFPVSGHCRKTDNTTKNINSRSLTKPTI